MFSLTNNGFLTAKPQRNHLRKIFICWYALSITPCFSKSSCHHDGASLFSTLFNTKYRHRIQANTGTESELLRLGVVGEISQPALWVWVTVVYGATENLGMAWPLILAIYSGVFRHWEDRIQMIFVSTRESFLLKACSLILNLDSFYFIFFRNYLWEISCRVSSRTDIGSRGIWAAGQL